MVNARDGRRTLSLPEEFALLSVHDDGKLYDPGQAATGCAAAELGELALRGKLLVQVRKFRLAGLDVYRPRTAAIHLLDTRRTGLAWADDVLAGLARQSASGPVLVKRWLRQRRDAFALHRDALVARGLLHYQANELPKLFGGGDRYHPDTATRRALISELHLGGPDPHTLFLSDLVVISELSKYLRIRIPIPQRLDRARGGAVPQALRDTSGSLASSVLRRSRHQD
jgi:Golgi phosphoprotein 3 (GPP34)